jgi:leader peptidase (prepilin peptidase) / N-methyltransferase
VDPLGIALFAVAGLAVGSFLTVLVHRLPRRESIARPRSACPSCGTPLRARDNVPVVSWLLLRGRCHACRARISPVYPLTEAATTGLFAGAAVAFERPGVAAMVAAFLAVMVAAALIDIRHGIIPNRLVAPSLLGLGAWVAVLDLVDGGARIGSAGLGLLAYGGGLLVVALIAPRGMGMGDVKLAALIGLVLGSFGLSYVGVAAGVGVIGGGIGALVALALLGAGRKDQIPFGPFLAGGAVVATLLGPRIADLYLSLLGVR